MSCCRRETEIWRAIDISAAEAGDDFRGLNGKLCDDLVVSRDFEFSCSDEAGLVIVRD